MLKKYKSDSGEIMLESSIIMSITLIVLVAMIGLGFYLYQQSMVYTVASETAVYIAENYKYSNLDKIDITSVDVSQMYNLKKYRAFLSLANRNNAGDYISQRSLKTNFGSDAVQIEDLHIYRDNIGRQRVELKVSMEGNILFENVLVRLGLIESNPKFKATAYAECMDLTEYSGQVFFVNYIGGGVENSKIGNIYNKFSGQVGKVKNLINSIVN